MVPNETSVSRILAASCYTRGLWSPVLIWRALSLKPYRGHTTQWGLEIALIKKHLKKAILLNVAAISLYAALTFAFALTSNSWLLFLLVLSILLQWVFIPWWATRKVLQEAESSSETLKEPTPEEVLIVKDSASAIPDLGYLLREATFSVDCDAPRESATEQVTDVSDRPTADDFYSEISQAAAGVSAFQVHRLRVLTPNVLQPGTSEWGPWYKPSYSKKLATNASPSSRLIILAQYPGIDGLSATELMIRNIGPHLSFIFRLRWIPPLSKRLHRLAHLARQRAWWRAGLVPLILTALLLVQWFAFGAYYLLQTEQLGELSPLKAGRDGLSIYLDLFSSPVLLLISKWGAMAPAAVIAIFAAFGPLLLFFAILIYRGLRYARGSLYAATGTHLSIESPKCYRFVASRFWIEDGEELSWAMSCCRIMEEIVTNRVVDVLHRHGIDTRSIREELGTFVNQGIYMTGGNIVAENMAVGHLARIFRKGTMKRSRHGQRSLLSNPTTGIK